jgi:hypothetical protein
LTFETIQSDVKHAILIVRHSLILMKVDIDRYCRRIAHCIRIDHIPVSMSIENNPVQLTTYSLLGRSILVSAGLDRGDVVAMFLVGEIGK